MNSIFSIVVLVICALFLSTSEGVEDQEKRIVCYFESWAVYRPGKGKYDVEDIDPHLCTHGIFCFAGLNASSYKIISLDPYDDLYDDYGLGAFMRFSNLTRRNPNFVPMIAVGGWNQGSAKFSTMASTSASRKIFVDSALDFMKKYGFKGLDLYWEYPTQRDGKPEDKQNYVQLLKELREAFDPRGYVLSAAVSAGKATIDAAYHIPEVSTYLHFINLMTYDYHGDWETYTGLNAPLYSRPDDCNYDRFLNLNFSVHYWIENGAPADKINLGLAAYGRTFTTAGCSYHGLYASTTGPGQAGPYIQQAGDMGYNEICEALMSHPDWPIVRDHYYRAPYTYHGNQWIGYDDVESIWEKCEFANSMNLGGAMVWSIDTDDFLGICGGGKYALMNVINEVIRGGYTPSPTKPTTT